MSEVVEYGGGLGIGEERGDHFLFCHQSQPKADEDVGSLNEEGGG